MNLTRNHTNKQSDFAGYEVSYLCNHDVNLQVLFPLVTQYSMYIHGCFALFL